MASNRSQAVQYITWGILLVIGALILLLTKFLASNPIIAFIIGGALIVAGIAYFKRNGVLGVILVLTGGLFLLTKVVTNLLGVISWTALVLGVLALIVGFLKVKK